MAEKINHYGWLAALMILWLLPGTGAAAKLGSEVQVDAGYIMPRGDLKDGFLATDRGFGADPGLEVGFLWRYRFNQRWSLAPAFHFLDFGNFNGTDASAGKYKIQSSSYRYGLQLRRSFRAGKSWQPFLVAGVVLCRNRVMGRDKATLDPFDQSISALGYSLQAGIRRGDVELGVVGTVDRFSSWRFFSRDERFKYNWDTVCVRFSWLIPNS